ncbi:MAG: DNA polymerase ligase N-terminal domain-containing protein [Candidatus Woesearchaeota archaeon]
MPDFVVHEHHARKLHWDLRLETEGVLKSWALPKMPLSMRGIKRLAIQVEDHPIDYKNFEGTIPEGYYGAGTVKIYDSGKYELIDKKDDKIVFKLHGKKLNGVFVLLRLKKIDTRQWLFFKIQQ